MIKQAGFHRPLAFRMAPAAPERHSGLARDERRAEHCRGHQYAGTSRRFRLLHERE